MPEPMITLGTEEYLNKDYTRSALVSYLQQDMEMNVDDINVLLERMSMDPVETWWQIEVRMESTVKVQAKDAEQAARLVERNLAVEVSLDGITRGIEVEVDFKDPERTEE